MVYRLVADAVVLVHFGFILFVALGGLLAWRWPRLLLPHVAAVAWGAGIVAIGWVCPLTPIEKHFRRLGGEQGYEGGFVDRYIEGVIYPDRYTPWLRLLVALLIVLGWAGLYLRRRRDGRTDEFRLAGGSDSLVPRSRTRRGRAP
jgi:Protein of Unknown function (DUF2784)